MLATYNTTVQMLVPDWVKARSLALYQTAIFGGLAAGSFMWGHFAGTLGVSGALAGAGVMWPDRCCCCTARACPSRWTRSR